MAALDGPVLVNAAGHLSCICIKAHGVECCKTHHAGSIPAQKMMHAPNENQIPSYYIVTAKSSLCTLLSVDDRRDSLNGKASRAIAEPDPMVSRTGVGKLGCRVFPC